MFKQPALPRASIVNLSVLVAEVSGKLPIALRDLGTFSLQPGTQPPLIENVDQETASFRITTKPCGALSSKLRVSTIKAGAPMTSMRASTFKTATHSGRRNAEPDVTLAIRRLSSPTASSSIASRSAGFQLLHDRVTDLGNRQIGSKNFHTLGINTDSECVLPCSVFRKFWCIIFSPNWINTDER